MNREFWRTLEERADDPAFQERLYNEFPSEIEAITDPVARRGFLKLGTERVKSAFVRVTHERVAIASRPPSRNSGH